ncbi:MAG: 3-hydroxyacyl-ACP dehydratase [Chitinophagales bacterium]
MKPLKNDFYTLQSLESEEGGLKAGILINVNHPILQGHFPGQPVVPGVCMVQIVKELLEERLAGKFGLASADHIKFLSLIDPRITPAFTAELKFEIIDSQLVKVNAGFSHGDILYFKLQGGYFQKKKGESGVK